MKNILYTIILSFLFSFSVFADYQAGLDASKAGDAETAIKEWAISAKQGDARAQYSLGLIYGVAVQDFNTSIKWLRLAAEQGHAKAQTQLGNFYYKGEGGVVKDLVVTYMWYDIGYNNGHTNALKLINALAPEMTPEQIVKAKKLSRECVKKNYKDCVPIDSANTDWKDAWDAYNKGNYATALKIFRALAEQGHSMAQNNFGWMHERGEGVTQDYKKAVKFYRMAAEQGNDIAQTNLANAYKDGKGTIKDMVIAYMWFNISASSGNKKAIEMRDTFTQCASIDCGIFTSEQLMEAEKLSRECVKKNYKDCG